MTEHPLLCRAPVVQSLLAGRQTQDRRPIKPQPARCINDWTQDAEVGEVVMYRGWPHRLSASRGRNKRDAGELTPTRIHPPWQVGDVLWVRETWGEDYVGSYLTSHGSQGQYLNGPKAEVVYKADGHVMTEVGTKWRPSIHMPRWACRILLEVTGVRAERVQEISEEDARAEGMEIHVESPSYCPACHGFGIMGSDCDHSYDCPLCATHVGRYNALWNSLYGDNAFGRNDWVWATTFRRIENAN